MRRAQAIRIARQGQLLRRHLVGVALAAIATGSCCSCGSGDTDSASTTAPPTSATTTSSGDPVRAAAIVWINGGGQDHLNALTSDLGATADAASNTDIAALNTACTNLQSGVEATQQYGPFPVQSVQTPFGEALAQYARSSDDCISGTSEQDPDLIGKATREQQAGTSALQEATTALKTYNGN